MAEISKDRMLQEELASALPDGFSCSARYVHTSARPCDPLFSSLPGSKPERTRLVSHFLTVSVNASQLQGHHGPVEATDPDILIFGMEVLVYTNRHLTTIFVSKADSTGYLPPRRPSPIKIIATTFVNWIMQQQREKHPRRKLVVSLFARSQNQYLFPGSIEHGKKHVLDDRQLIKWWAKTLNPLILPNNDTASPEKAHYQGYVTVPSYSSSETVRLFAPPGSCSRNEPRWKPGNPLRDLAATRGLPYHAPTRCFLPRFPDDPKARFISDLDDEVGLTEETRTMISPSKRKSGRWSSIHDLDRFWEAMEFRQECSSGRVVGFIWLVVSPSWTQGSQEKFESESQTNDSGDSQQSQLSAPSPTPATNTLTSATNHGSLMKRKRTLLSGPITPRQPRLKGGSSNLSATSEPSSRPNAIPHEGVCVASDGYDKAMQALLHLDFANLEVARQSTSKWISEVSSVSGICDDWALNVIGRAKTQVTVSTNGSSEGASNAAQVNDLGGMVRKKRKAVDCAASEDNTKAEEGDGVSPVPEVNMLGAAMIRKKPKPA